MSATAADILQTFRSRIERLLKVEENRKLDVYVSTFEAAEIADLNYWLQLFLAAGIATLGLVQNSAAVIIGAMLVSPLMGPIIAAGLALALGDFYLGLKAVLNLVASVAAAVLFAAGIVRLVPFQSVTPEILARTQPNLLDLAIAVFSGLAGSIVTCRGGGGGGVTALPGVAVAVALMPPLCVVGFGVGTGFQWAIVRGGGLLFLTNLVAIVASAFVTFFVVRMDSPAVRGRINQWLEAEERTEALYALLQHTALRRLLGRVGTLPRRASILMLFLLTIYFPLRSGLERVREETTIRNVVRSEIRRAFRPDSVVSQRVDIGPPIRIEIVATDSIAAEKTEQLRREIASRTGRPVELLVQEVARKQDVLELSRQLASVPVTVPELDTARARILSVIESALAASWPAESAPLVDYSLNLRPSGLQLQVTYLSEVPLGGPGEEAVRRAVEARAGAKLGFVFERLEPRLNLLRLGHSPAAAEKALAGLAEILRRWPVLSCRILLPPRAAPQTGEALAAILEKHGVARGRIQLGASDSREPWVYGLLELSRP